MPLPSTGQFASQAGARARREPAPFFLEQLRAAQAHEVSSRAEAIERDLCRLVALTPVGWEPTADADRSQRWLPR